MNITEIQSAANEGNIDKIYELIEAASPSDSEREQLQEIALQHVEANPEVAVAVTLGTSEEFGREIYKTLLMKNQLPALKAMKDGGIPGSDTPFYEDLLMIAEHCSTEVWDWVMDSVMESSIFDGQIESEIAELIGAAAVVAADKNPPLYEKLKSSTWTWEKHDGNEADGGVGVLAALHSNNDDFKKLIAAYQPDLAECAVAAAESGRLDNLKVIAEMGYDLTRYPLDRSNGTLADIAALYDQTDTVEWLLSQGVHRDF